MGAGRVRVVGKGARWTGKAPRGGEKYILADLTAACEAVYRGTVKPTKASQLVFENEGRYLPVATIKHYVTGPKGANRGNFAWRALDTTPRKGPPPALGTAAEGVLLAVIVFACVLGFGFTKGTILAAAGKMAAAKGLRKRDCNGGESWWKLFVGRGLALFGIDITSKRVEGLSKHRARSMSPAAIQGWKDVVDTKVIAGRSGKPLRMKDVGNSDEWAFDLQGYVKASEAYCIIVQFTSTFMQCARCK